MEGFPNPVAYNTSTSEIYIIENICIVLGYSTAQM